MAELLSAATSGITSSPKPRAWKAPNVRTQEGAFSVSKTGSSGRCGRNEAALPSLADQKQRSGNHDYIVEIRAGASRFQRFMHISGDPAASGDLGQRFRPQGSGVARSGENQLAREREQNSGDLLDGFVAHRAINDPDLAARIEALQVLRQRAGTGRIVRSIQNDVGVGSDAFQATRPARLADSARRDAQLIQRDGGSDRVLH